MGVEICRTKNQANTIGYALPTMRLRRVTRAFCSLDDKWDSMKAARKSRGIKNKPATFDTARQIALALPGVEEGISYGTAAFRVRGKFLARLKEDGDSLVIRIEGGHRDFLMKEDPETFYITEHYRNYPAMLIRLSRVRHEDLGELIEN